MERKNLNFEKQGPDKVKEKAEAFLNLADELPPAKLSVEQLQAAPTNQEHARSALNLGPSYLTALDSINKKADLRAFETDLPILKVQAAVGPLTGKEEQVLKTSSVSTNKFLMELNKLLYSHADFEGVKFSNFDDFLENMFPPDKSMLVWALLTSTYLKLPDMERKCSKCSQDYILESVPKDLIHNDSLPQVWDKGISPNEYTEVQTAMDGFLTFEIGLPSEKTRIKITSTLTPNDTKENIAKNANLFGFAESLMYFTKSITVGEGDNRTVLTDPFQDIKPFLENLAPKITDSIRSEIDIKIFDKYMPSFYLNAACTHCGNIEKVLTDPELSFFRKTILI